MGEQAACQAAQHGATGRWYALLDGEVRGPWTADALRALPELGAVTQVCREGTEQWLPLSALAEEKRPAAAVPAAPVLTPVVPPAAETRAGALARILTVPRPVLLLALCALSWLAALAFDAAFRSHLEPRLEEAQSLILQDKGREAEVLCRAVLAETDDSFLGHFLLGEALLQQGRKREALAAYKAAQAVRPNDQRAEAKIIILSGMPGL